MSNRKSIRESTDDRTVWSRKSATALAIMFAMVVVAIVAFMLWRARDAAQQPPPAHATSPPLMASPNYHYLVGQWQRPDGGYIIDIVDIEAGGKMQAGYYNPQPIRVSKAEASQPGATASVFIELNDIGYPGSTYTLTYDPQSDQLLGVYYQAALQQNYEVVFVRME